MIEQFRTWLATNRHFLFSWYTKDSHEEQEPEKTLVELPKAVEEKLVDRIKNLSSNPADKEAIVSTLDETFTRWCEHPNIIYNSVVILSSPLTGVSRILSETLKEWVKQKQVAIKLLPLTARPTDIESIKSKLEYYLKEDNSENHPLEVVVIPNLSWYFLRSLEGLEGIEYLQSLLGNGSKHRFWIIGAGRVNWEYLNSVFKLQAYCGEVFALPAIAPEKFQQWFEPIVNELDITFDKPPIDQQLLDGDQDNKTNYFDCLADVSQGVSTVAVQVFLKSIGYQEIEEEEQESKQKTVIAQTPKLPDLPPLDSNDQYLLYSLLLHGDLTLSTLAESLGDEELEVQARIQVLRRQGLIEQQEKILKINPIYYPKLKQELASNNFIVNP